MIVSFVRNVHRSIWQLLLYTFVGIFVFGIYWLTNTESPPPWLSESINVDIRIKQFLSTWCKIRTSRTNWKVFTNSCLHDMQWNHKENGSEEATFAYLSEVHAWDVRPAGEFSTIWIKSRQRNNKLQQRGGDSWRGQLKGPSSPVVSIFDHNNGTYEAVFLPIEHGYYKARFFLEHSNCDGIKEPPHNWFIIGNVQGRGQQDGTLGNFKPYIGQFLGGPSWGFTFEVPRQVSLQYVREMARILFGPGNICSESCNLLWDGYGRWINKTWEPYRVGEDYSTSLYRWERKRNGILWFYGDSVMEQFFNNVKKSGNLCQGFQHGCWHTYNWIYRINNYNTTAAKELNDDLDFNSSKVVEEFKEIISKKALQLPESVLILNFGLHFVTSTNSTAYKSVIDGIIEVINKERAVGDFQGGIIWRTTTAIRKDKLRVQHKDEKRFFTYQRIKVFNAYATTKMCASGISVLDVFPLTDSYPYGTGWNEKPNDAVHYEHSVFRSVETLLYHRLRTTR